MAWSWLQSASNTGTGVSSIAATFTTANLTSGTKLIAVVGNDQGGVSATTSTVKDGAGNSFTKLATIQGSTGGPVEVTLWAIDTPAGDAGTKPTITATFSAASGGSILVQEVSGLLAGNTSAMLDGTAATLQATTVLAGQAQPSYSSTASNEYLVACFGDNGGPETYTVPGGYTADTAGQNNNSNADTVIAYKSSTGGAESGTWTFTGTATGAGYIVVAFKLPAAGAPSLALPLQAPPQPSAPPPPPRSRVIPFLGALTGTAVLSGSGTLTAAPFFSAAATLSGSGTLTATFTTAGTAPYVIQAPAQPPQPPRPPAAQVIGTPLAVAFTRTATLTGTGTLAAAPYFDATGTVLSGSGTLAAGPGVGGLPLLISPVIQPPQPVQPPRGQIIGLTPSAFLGAATLTGSGTLAAAPFFSAAAALSGTGTLTAAYTVAGAPPYVITAVIQPAQPVQPPPGRLLGVPPPPPPPVLLSATIAATVGEGTTMTATVTDAATIAGTVSEQARITASVT